MLPLQAQVQATPGHAREDQQQPTVHCGPTSQLLFCAWEGPAGCHDQSKEGRKPGGWGDARAQGTGLGELTKEKSDWMLDQTGFLKFCKNT